MPRELVGLTCGAKTRAGTPCKRTDIYRNGRCKFHGGLSTGPRADEGKAIASREATPRNGTRSAPRLRASHPRLRKHPSPCLYDIDSDKSLCRISHRSSSNDADRLGPSEQPSDTQCRASHSARGRTYDLTGEITSDQDVISPHNA